MRRNCCALVLLVLAIAPVAMARVISYPPYTKRFAERGIHLRTTRHFVLVEGNQVVLYDSTDAKRARISIRDDRRRRLDQFIVDLKPASGMQINDLFASRKITAPKAATIVVELEGPGRITAYATDNVTNDTTFLGPQLGATQ